MKTVKKKTVRQGTRRMINAQAVTPYGLLTYRGGETAFFLLRPTCISVLPEDALAARVGALVTLFKSQPELEILCLNSRESFANNTRYLEARIGEEENPYIADLLEKDKAHLGSVQLQTATAREFVLAVQLEAVREKEKYPYLARVEKLIRDQGFDVRRADLDDVKRLMAVYFVQDFTSEHYDDFDGQRWVEWTGVQADRKAPDSASQEAAVKEFLDLAAPSVLRFETDRFICGNTYRCVWAVRGYPASTTEQALLHRLGEKAGVSVHIYTRRVTPAEEKKILQNADKANRLKAGNTGNVQDVVEAESNLQDMAAMLTLAHRNQEPFLHTAVFIEMIANDPEHLRMLQSEVEAELNCCKISADHLLLRQKQGFQSVMPSGWNAFGTEDCIEMTYHMEYCENCQQGGLEGAMNLFSLMGCNLYDVHLCDGDEDHELTTVVELNQDTLTEDGRREWSDVLNAKVTSIYEGHYGVQIGLTGCPAERLRDFSFMLAGHCPAEDYDRWVNSGEQEQAQTEPKQFM